MTSTRDQIRDLAEEALRGATEPMHYTKIAALVLDRLGLSAAVTPKTVNTCLHDDSKARFVRVGAGTWTLRENGR